jgi:small conductance mechanosensitive channel
VFFANCEEGNRFQVQRDLNKEIKLLFDAHGIEIAFPQVVVHQAKENSKKK